MYIRRVTHAHKKNRHEYHTYKLVESLRTERGPRQRMLLNLGTDFTLPEEKWKDLANRIEGIITGQECLFVYPEEIENLARRYARKIIRYQGRPVFKKSGIPLVDSPLVDEPDYTRVDINTLENEHPRSVGSEYVVHEMIKELELYKKLSTLGFRSQFGYQNLCRFYRALEFQVFHIFRVDKDWRLLRGQTQDSHFQAAEFLDDVRIKEVLSGLSFNDVPR